MEDPAVEWEIKDYSSSYLEDEELSEKSSKLGWILETGLSLGKKFVITGFVISSVPLVLPPLVVVSALGLAASVPFGFIFASYAGAQKLMSTLLPSPQLIDYEAEEEEEEAITSTEKEREGDNEIVIEFLDSDDGAKEDKLRNEDQFTEDRVSKVYDEPNVGENMGVEHVEGTKEQEGLSRGDQFTEDKVVGQVSEEQNVSEPQEEKNARTEELSVKERESEGQNAVQVVKITEPVIEVKTVTIVEDKDKEEIDSSQDKNGKTEKNVAAVKDALEKDKKRQTNSKGKSSAMEPDTKKAKKKTSTTVQKPSGKKKGDKKHEKAPVPEVVAEERTSGSPSEGEGIVIGSGNVENSQVMASKKDDEQSVLPGGEKVAKETSKGKARP